MYEYDRLLNLADTEGISVVEKDFKSDLKGLCIGKKIAIDKNMSEAEKKMCPCGRTRALLYNCWKYHRL